jgi:hypothetical protein
MAESEAEEAVLLVAAPATKARGAKREQQNKIPSFMRVAFGN